MLALIYLALAIYLGDLLCQRFYRFVSTPHRWAAAILVGILLSTWFNYLVGLAFAHTSGALLWADLLFFVVTSGAIFWLSRKAPKVNMIPLRAPGSSTWDWITIGALFAATCLLLIGTLYVNKQGTLRLYGKGTSDLAPQLAIVQSVGLGRDLLIEFPQYVNQTTQFLFFFQAGNLKFLGLNIAWSVNVLSVLVLSSMLILVMVLGELLSTSRVVGRLGATLFFFHGSLRHLINFLSSQHLHGAETWVIWKQIAFVNQRHLPFAVGIFLLVLIFLVDSYRRRTSGRSFLFTGLLVAAVPLWNAPVFVVVAVVLVCLFIAYGLWRLTTLQTPPMLGRVLASAFTVCILASGLIDLLAVYRSSGVEINYETEPLVKGLVFRNSMIYKVPASQTAVLASEAFSKTPVTTVQGGQRAAGNQFDSPRGIAVDSGGNIFVADTNNGRIAKLSPGSTFITRIGTKGTGHGQFGEPNGIAVDRAGNIYVAEASNHRVQILRPDGTFIAAWAPGFYGPRRIAIGPDDSIYVVDQGRTRIVKFSPDGQILATWGSAGSGDGQFADQTSVAVDPTTNKVYVADPINRRIQVFDSTGRFLTKWPVPEWGRPSGFEDLAIDPDRDRLYSSSAHMNTILAFDLQGNRIGTLEPTAPDKLESPSGLALAKNKLLVLNSGSARVSVIHLQNR